MTYTNSVPAFFETRRYGLCGLIFTWGLGFVVGCWIFNSGQALFSSLVLSASACTVSIVGLLSVMIPFLISAVAVIYHKPIILYALCFIKSSLYSLSVLAVYSVYGSAGWLAQFLILFLDNCTMAALWLVWSGCFSFSKTTLLKVFAVSFGTCVLVWVFDFCYISRFAVSVLNW